jgi:hypothetical protein
MEWAIFIIALVLYIYTYLAGWATVSTTTKIGLTFFPRFLLGLLILSSSALLFILRGHISIDAEYVLEKRQKLVLLAYPLSMIALVFTVWYVGLITGFYSFILLWMYFLGQRSRFILFLLPLISALVIYAVFKAAGIFIPEGLFF